MNQFMHWWQIYTIWCKFATNILCELSALNLFRLIHPGKLVLESHIFFIFLLKILDYIQTIFFLPEFNLEKGMDAFG